MQRNPPSDIAVHIVLMQRAAVVHCFLAAAAASQLKQNPCVVLWVYIMINNHGQPHISNIEAHMHAAAHRHSLGHEQDNKCIDQHLARQP